MAKKLNDDNFWRALEARSYWVTHGDPIKVRDIDRALAAGELPSNDLLNTSPVKPQREDFEMEDLEIPARTGKGSGVNVWRAFAKRVTDMDPEVIDEMSKEDLIGTLESTGVIPAEEE